MTQEELVKKAIDVLINGKDDIHYLFKKNHIHESLSLHYGGGLIFKDLWDYKRGVSNAGYDIRFDKNVKNMAMLIVLLRDWTNKRRDHRNWYKQWIKIGPKP